MDNKSRQINSSQKIIDPKDLSKKVAEIRAAGKTIATINGSFDLMHAGHLHILFEGAKQADVLLVALNSDSSIQKYKSPDRPIIPLEYRMKMMAAIGAVEYVTYFNETDPCTILEIIKPDVHVNGADYGINCIEAEVVRKNGGRLHLVDIIPSLSTTEIIKKIVKIEAARK